MLHTHDIPAPESATALLVPDLRDRRGRSLAPRATVHYYSHTEERVELTSGESYTVSEHRMPLLRDGEVRDVSYAHIFVCSETGAERVYGCDGDPSPGCNPEED
jgi:hypothetical protein